MVDGLLAVEAIDALSEAPLAVRIALMVAGVLIIGIGIGLLHRRRAWAPGRATR